MFINLCIIKTDTRLKTLLLISNYQYFNMDLKSNNVFRRPCFSNDKKLCLKVAPIVHLLAYSLVYVRVLCFSLVINECVFIYSIHSYVYI